MTHEELKHSTENFSFAKRGKSFSHAIRGVHLFFKMTHNAWIHMTIFVMVIIGGIYFDITSHEWVSVVLASGLVFIAECFNTAMEIDMNITSPGEHPFARDTKDVSAGAVLIASVTALIVGLFVFVPYVTTFFS